MAAKQLLFEEDARKALLRGVEKLSRSVAEVSSRGWLPIRGHAVSDDQGSRRDYPSEGTSETIGRHQPRSLRAGAGGGPGNGHLGRTARRDQILKAKLSYLARCDHLRAER